MNDPVPSAVQEIVDLFVSEFASLRFGDLEPTALAAACEEVKAVAANVIRAETELENVRAMLAAKKDALLHDAQRALAYARVYAENRPELGSRLERIALPRPPRRSGKVEPAPSDAELTGTLEVTAPPARRRARSRTERGAMSVEDTSGPAAAPADNSP